MKNRNQSRYNAGDPPAPDPQCRHRRTFSPSAKLPPRLLPLLLLPFLLAHTLMGLNPDKNLNSYIHRNWTSKNGLPQDTVHTIVQDKDGFLWIGTDKGLTRFDGLEFKRFTKADTPAIKNDSITALYYSRDHTLWIGTYGGGITMYRDKRFLTPTDKIPHNLIKCFAEDSEDTLWIGTVGGGILQYKVWKDIDEDNENNFKNKKFAAVTMENGLASDLISDIHVDEQDKIWIGTANGLNVLKDGHFTRYSTEQGLTDNNIKTIHRDSKGSLWIGTPEGVTIIPDPNTAAHKTQFIPITTADGLSDNYIHGISEDRDGAVWLATNKGLNRLSPNACRRKKSGLSIGRGNGVESFTSENGLSDNTLLSLHEDRWGNIWMGTAAGGLNVLQEGRFSFFTTQNGLSSDSIKTVYQDRSPEPSLWIGTDGGGLNRYVNGKTETFTTRHGLAANTVESLYGDGKGNLWIGTAKGLNHLDIKTKKITLLNKRSGLSNEDVKAIYTDSSDTTWIGTFGGGLNRYKNGEIETITTANGLTDNYIQAITEDKQGFLWVGTNGGLSRLKDNRIDNWRKEDGLSSDMILDLYCDQDNTMWIATRGGGLMRFKDGRFTQIEDESNGFSGSAVYRIIEDWRANLWLTTNRGIFSVSRRALNQYAEGKSLAVSAYHYHEADGLKTSVCAGGSQPAGWRSTDGKLWFPTSKGIAMIDLKPVHFRIEQPMERITRQPPNPTAPPTSFITVVRDQAVVIDRLMVNGKESKLKPHNILPRDTDKLEFFFRVKNYTAPDKLLYKYRLLGHDQEWRNADGNRVVYQNIPHGKYEFKVLARNSYGDWVFRGDSYSFFIEPPFYHSFWFYFFITAALALGIAAYPRFKQRQRRKETERLELEMQLQKRKKDQKDGSHYASDNSETGSQTEDGEKEKYKTSSLSSEQSAQYMTKLTALMESQKPYLDPKLTIQDLADMMECPKEALSQVINENANMNFNNYLNQYRVREAKAKLTDPKENQFVLLKIALDAGFNSKSVFNAAFKKFTGLSPSQYRKRHQRK